MNQEQLIDWQKPTLQKFSISLDTAFTAGSNTDAAATGSS